MCSRSGRNRRLRETLVGEPELAPAIPRKVVCRGFQPKLKLFPKSGTSATAPWRVGIALHQILDISGELTALRERSASDLHLFIMDFCPQAEINQLLVKAGRLRRAATATSMADYRSMMLRVARELEAKAAAIEIEVERYTPH